MKLKMKTRRAAAKRFKKPLPVNLNVPKVIRAIFLRKKLLPAREICAKLL